MQKLYCKSAKKNADCSPLIIEFLPYEDNHIVKIVLVLALFLHFCTKGISYIVISPTLYINSNFVELQR